MARPLGEHIVRTTYLLPLFTKCVEEEFSEVHSGQATPRCTLWGMRQTLEPFILLARCTTKAAGAPPSVPPFLTEGVRKWC